MPNFRSFRRKYKPPPPMQFWQAEVVGRIDPLELTPGAVATHTVAIENYDVVQCEVTINAICLGPHLRYGSVGTWTPATVRCDPEARIDPAAITRVGLPADTHSDALPTIEQIEMRVTLTLDPPLREPEEQRCVYTLRLNDRS